MGFSSEYQLQREIEDETIEQLKTIYDDIYDERAKGVLRQIYGQGLDSLSKKQDYIYGKYIEPIRAARFAECVRCCQTIDTEHAFEINDENEYICDWCWDDYMSRDS